MQEVNVVVMKCLRSIVGVTQVCRFNNKDVCRKAGTNLKRVGGWSGSESVEMVIKPGNNV